MDGKRMGKRLLSALLCVALIALMLPAASLGERERIADERIVDESTAYEQESSEIQAEEKAKYATPKLLGVGNETNGVRITWEKVKKAPAYRVFRRSSPKEDWKAVGHTKKTTYVDTTTKSNVSYTYTVAVIAADTDEAKVESGTEAGKTIVFYAAPTLVSAAVQSNGILFQWKAVNGAKRYRIYRKKNGGAWVARAVVGNVTSYLDADVDYGATYTYTVCVMHAKNNQELSKYDPNGLTVTFTNRAEITGFEPGAKFKSSGVRKADWLTVSWTKIKGAGGYQVWRKMGAGGWQSVYIGKKNKFKDKKVMTNVTYTYYVRATDGSGNYIGTYDAVGRSWLFLVPPTLVSCVRSGGGLMTTWLPVEGASSYSVYRKVGNGAWILIGVSTTTSFTDISVPSDNSCLYTVACNHANGEVASAYNPKGIGPNAYYMDRPTLVSAVNWTDGTDSGVAFTWRPVSTGTATEPEGTATDYTVYRREGDTLVWEFLGTTSGGQTTYYDIGLVNGRKYSYTVAVRDPATGADISLYNEAGLSVTYYDAPVLDSVSCTAGGAQVTWYMVDGASSYRIWRRTGNSTWSALGTMAAGTYSYTDSTVAHLGHYWYTVSAIGDSESAYHPVGKSISRFYWPPSVLTVAIGDGQMELSWPNVDDVNRFYIEKRVGNGSWTHVQTTKETSWKDKNVTSGKQYTYRISCMAPSGSTLLSGARNSDSVTYLSRVKIREINVAVAKQAILFWDAVEDVGNITYTVEYHVLGGEWVTAATGLKPADVRKGYTVKRLTSGTNYWFRVTAYSGQYSNVPGYEKKCTVR